jgi:DNA-binding NarL/FixJ family response regulator
MAASGPFDQARTELLHGLVLIKQARTAEAVEVLGGAMTTFEQLGAYSWAQLARNGIRSGGGSPPVPRLGLVERLTPLELEVAVAAAQGSSAIEISERLFLGPRTVQMQLASATIKLGLDSPAGLADVLREASVEVATLA